MKHQVPIHSEFAKQHAMQYFHVVAIPNEGEHEEPEEGFGKSVICEKCSRGKLYPI